MFFFFLRWHEGCTDESKACLAPGKKYQAVVRPQWSGRKRALYLHQNRSWWLRAVVMVMASTKCHVCKDFYFHLFTAASYNCLQPAWKGSKENEYRLLRGESAGGISLISVANTKKGYIIREKQSPVHPSLCVFHCMYSLPPHFNQSLSAHLFSLFYAP